MRPSQKPGMATETTIRISWRFLGTMTRKRQEELARLIAREVAREVDGEIVTNGDEKQSTRGR